MKITLILPDKEANNVDRDVGWQGSLTLCDLNATYQCGFITFPFTCTDGLTFTLKEKSLAEIMHENGDKGLAMEDYYQQRYHVTWSIEKEET